MNAITFQSSKSNIRAALAEASKPEAVAVRGGPSQYIAGRAVGKDPIKFFTAHGEVAGRALAMDWQTDRLTIETAPGIFARIIYAVRKPISLLPV